MFPSVAADVWCSIVISHVFYGDSCYLSVALGGGGRTLLPSDIHTHNTHKTGGKKPCCAVCSQFPALTFGFRCFSEPCGDNSRSLSLPPPFCPSGDTTR